MQLITSCGCILIFIFYSHRGSDWCSDWEIRIINIYQLKHRLEPQLEPLWEFKLDPQPETTPTQLSPGVYALCHKIHV